MQAGGRRREPTQRPETWRSAPEGRLRAILPPVRKNGNPLRSEGRRGLVRPGDDLLSPAKDYHRPRGLNGRVRDGNGCGPPGVVTGMRSCIDEAAVRAAM